jgi:D-lactate dehydrogenase
VGETALQDLASRVKGRLILRKEELARFQRDGSHLVGGAVAALLPADDRDVVETIQWARTNRVPLVARGGGSSLDGECVPSAGSVVVDFSGWNAILSVDSTHRTARVQPGVVNRELHRALADHRLFFPPNPGSWLTSTIGGNAATNAAGPRSFRYGATRRWVRGARVVLGTGEVVSLGHQTTKRSAGPELLDWVIGSEGTLGWFLELSVALAPRPEVRTGFVVPRPAKTRLGDFVARLLTNPGIPISAVEFIDAGCARELHRLTGRPLPEGRDLILLELESSRAEETRHLEQLLDAVNTAGGTDDPLVYPDADELWTLRGQSSLALDATLGERVREDVAVPLGQVDALLDAIHRISERLRVPVYVFGHLGDGNLHPNFVVDPASGVADAVRSELWQAARDLGGTTSAEHGIGVLKNAALAFEHPPPAFRAWREVKRVLDPDGILNPGKLEPPSNPRAAESVGSSPGAGGTGGTQPE